MPPTPPSRPHLRPPSVESLVEALLSYESSLVSAPVSHTAEQRANTAGCYSTADDELALPHWSAALDTFRYSHTYLNRGADGCPSPSVFLLREFITRICYEQPMVYHRSIVPRLVKRAKNAVCKYLKIPTENSSPAPVTKNSFSFLPSVSQGLFAVLQSITWQKVRYAHVHVASPLLTHLANTHTHTRRATRSSRPT